MSIRINCSSSLGTASSNGRILFICRTEKKAKSHAIIRQLKYKEYFEDIRSYVEIQPMHNPGLRSHFVKIGLRIDSVEHRQSIERDTSLGSQDAS